MPIVESFASIVGLIGQFRSERGALEQSDFNSFIEWLVKYNHEEIKDLLTLNAKATIGVKSILNQDRAVILSHLERIDIALASFSSNFDGFNDLAAGIRPSALISEQALSILRQFEKSGASKALEIETMAETFYQFLDGTNDGIEINDPRFAEDDFKSLVELGLLRHDINGSGSNLFIYTRRAALLVAESGDS